MLSLLMNIGPLKAQDYQQQIDKLAEDVAGTATKLDLKNIAILDFTDLQGNTQELGRFLAEELTTSLVLKERSFKTIDRSHLRSILQEQRLSMTGIQGKEEAKKLKISGIDGLVRGTITPFGESIRLTLQVITVENGTIVGAARGTVPKTSAMESLGSNVEASSNNSLDGGAASQSSPKAGKATVVQDKNLKITLKYFKKSSDNQIKAIFTIENLREEEISVALDPHNRFQIVDDQGDQWRMHEQTGIAGSNFNPSPLAPAAPLTAVFVFTLDKGVSKATKFNIVGTIEVQDGRTRTTSYISFPDIRLGI